MKGDTWRMRTTIEGVGSKLRTRPPKEDEDNATLIPMLPIKGKTKNKGTSRKGRQDDKDNTANEAEANETPKTMPPTETEGRRRHCRLAPSHPQLPPFSTLSVIESI